MLPAVLVQLNACPVSSKVCEGKMPRKIEQQVFKRRSELRGAVPADRRHQYLGVVRPVFTQTVHQDYRYTCIIGAAYTIAQNQPDVCISQTWPHCPKTCCMTGLSPGTG